MTASPPFVSVVMACYNAAPFIEQALISVVKSACTPLEVIVVDDGSADGSPDLVRRFAERTPDVGIRLCTHPGSCHRGQVATKNLGIRLAVGRYVAFLDADDEYLPNRFRVCVSMLEQNPAVEGIYEPFAYQYSDSERSRGIAGIMRGEQPQRQNDRYAESDPFMRVLRGQEPVHVSTITVHREVLLEMGGFPDLLTAQDMALMLKLFARRRMKPGQSEPVSLYRLHDASHCARLDRQAGFYLNPVRALLDARKWMRTHPGLVEAVHLDAVEKAAEGKFYSYCAKLHHRQYHWWPDGIGAMALMLRHLPKLLLNMRFCKVCLRVIAVQCGFAKPWPAT